MITIEELKNKMEELGYYATDEIIYRTFNALLVYKQQIPDPGQDIYTICLEGPPGAGKSFYAKTYVKLASLILQDSVEIVDYQCDNETNKNSMFEDINVSAAIRSDADNVNIPGILVRSINEVNKGKKVVLFIDEYDKAREETDSLLLKILQDGKINAIQYGDMKIKDEYKTNLQVIFCKNDFREELSGPLSRRIRIIRLDYMEPETFYKVAKRTLLDNKNIDANHSEYNAILGLINLVSLIYKSSYQNVELYDRLPACSEMLISIEDAYRLIKYTNAPQHVVYDIIIKNMFKSVDDIETFESILGSSSVEDIKNLKKVIDEMKNTQTNTLERMDLNDSIAKNMFVNQTKKLAQEYENLKVIIEEYKNRFNHMENVRKQSIDSEIQNINLDGGKLIAYTKPNAIKMFDDETVYIKRGYDIFDISNNDWTNIGYVNMNDLSVQTLIDTIKEYAKELNIVIYENGILISNDDNLKLILVCENNANNIKYTFMSNNPIIPPTYLNEIKDFVSFMIQVYELQFGTVQINTNKIDNTISIDSLVYSDNNLNYDQVVNNVYHIKEFFNIDDINNIDSIVSQTSCDDIKKVINASNSIMSQKKKELKNECS